jgi:hypothetical protein
MCAKAIWRPACQQGFEQKSQEMFGYEHVAAVNSGTTAVPAENFIHTEVAVR